MKQSRIRFVPQGAFHAELRRRVRSYFDEAGIATHGGSAALRKTAVLLAWLAASVGLFLAGGGLLLAIACGISTGLAMGGLGMAVQHDGGHRAFAASVRVNRGAAAILDLLGASSWFWRVKHGQLHHTYPNIDGADDDLDLAPFLRVAPGQPRRWYHRGQHIYAFALYSFFGLKWFLWDDFAQYARGRIGHHPVPRPRGLEALLFWGGKAAYLGWAFVIPSVVHGWLAGLVFLFAAQMTMSLLLSVIFQLAHCVEEADVVDRQPSPQSLELDFARHQLGTTVDFARGRRWLSWYCGGLNYQAVHHLFPGISHVHYPRLSCLVEQTCSEFAVDYKVTQSLRAALRSHYRWMLRMGRAVATDGEGAPRPVVC